MIDLTFDMRLIEREMARLRRVPDALQRALFPTVSMVIEDSRGHLQTRLAATAALPDKTIKKAIKAHPARVSGQGAEGRIVVSSKGIPIIEYDVQPKEVTARKGSRSKSWPGFTFALRSGERREREGLPSDSLPFIAAMSNKGKGGHLGVYHRSSAGKIKELIGPSVQYHATTPEMEADLISHADSLFSRILPRVVDSVLAGGQ